ncbi:hypothetical protein GF319_01500, partial [Candidatus Bathyarchaeota archaeon]|nr:hypothetical protein [Candidatus Bathyarchaeota archaeon]
MSETVEFYLKRLKDNTSRTSESILNQFFEYLESDGNKFKGYTPDQLIEYQRENRGSYEILDIVQDWIRTKDNLRKNTLSLYYSTVRGFFAHNRVGFPPDPRYSIKNGKPKVKGDLTISDLRRVIEASNPMYRAFFMCIVQGIMGIREAIYWSDNGLESLRTQLDNEDCPIKIEFPHGRKQNKNEFYSFIGHDAIAELRKYFEVREDSQDSIFITRWDSPLSIGTARHYWTRKLKSLALIKEKDPSNYEHPTQIRYSKNLHEIRDCMRSRWRLSGIDVEIAEFFMGHSDALDRYGYDKSPWRNPEYFRAEYM